MSVLPPAGSTVDVALLLHAISDAVIIVDTDWRIQQWNPAAVQIYGWQPAEVLGQLISTLIPVVRYLDGDTPASARDTLLQSASWRGLVVQPHRDGHELTIDVSVQAVRDAQGTLVAYLAINRDLSDRAKLTSANVQLLAEAQRARAEAEAHQLRLQFQAEASALLASSLDYQATLAHLVELTVPLLADGCLVYLRDDAGSVDLALVYHRDPCLHEVANILAHLEPAAFAEQHPLSIVLRTGQPVLIPEVSAERLAAGAHDDAFLQLLQQLNPRSSLFVPLNVRGQTSGVLALVITDDTRRFSLADQELALELARRVAQAIDNAQLYAASREAQALLDTLYATAPAGLAFVDHTLRFVRVNAALAEINGLPVAAHLGHSLREVLPHLAPRLEPIYRQVLDTAQPVMNLEISGETPATPGVTRSWLTSYYPVRLPDRAVLGVGVVVVEITERKEAEQTLREREEQLRLAHDAAQLGIWHRDLASGRIQLGAHAQAHFGVDTDVISVEMLLERVHPDDRVVWRQAIAATLDPAGDGRAAVEYRIVHPDGRIRWIAIHARAYFAGEGAQRRPIQSSGITQDITARKRLEEQLLQAQKMESIGQLAGGIAHDFNNLLTAIGGYADLALANMPPEAPIRADLLEIQRSTERAAALTRQLLAFARRQRMEMRPLDLNDLVGNLEKLLRRLIGDHIQLVVAPAPNLGVVAADHGQIEQVLINLAVNARDAMPAGGTLTIATTNVQLDEGSTHGHVDLPAGAYVLLAVSDTGVGIAPEIQPHLFEPFFTTKPIGQGTGLGLATCYGIVKQHGGTIWVYSEVGYGTVVKVYLPRGGVEVGRQQQETTPATLPRGTETVLIAEDEPAVRALIARVLRGCGYSVLEAADGVEAVRLARAHAPNPIHLLLSDVVMPHLGGPAAAAQIRVLYPALRQLLISGYTGISTLQHDVAGVDAPLLQKPFSPRALAIAVRAVLDT